jgi:hypothetical protein
MMPRNKPTPAEDGKFQIARDRIDHVFPNPENGNQEEQHAGAEHRRQRLLPGIFVAEHHREGEERVQPHAGRQRDRVIGVERHHRAAHRCRDAGRDEHGTLVHAGIGQDGGIDEHDVNHREERGHAGDHFGAHIRAVLCQPEIAVEERSGTCAYVGHRRPPCRLRLMHNPRGCFIPRRLVHRCEIGTLLPPQTSRSGRRAESLRRR